jgi:hypothetical protein
MEQQTWLARIALRRPQSALRASAMPWTAGNAQQI